jgi:ribosomal protein S18 acetylase RimI-like enzyme
MQEMVVVRRGTPADLDRLAEQWLAMFEEVGVFLERDFPPGWRTDFREYFRRRMNADEAAFFVAVDGEAIVGTAGALLRDGYPAAITGIRYGYIFGVRVAPEYRRRGFAERLAREAIAYLENSNCRNIRLHASRFGRSIYERIGFVPTNEMELAR